MNRTLKISALIGIFIFGAIGILYYFFVNTDYIGEKDHKIVEANLKRWNTTLLSAEFKNGTDYCKVDLLDSINIEINVGDKKGGTIINEKYKISHDTIIVIGGVKHANKYLNSDKFLIQKNKLLFKVNTNGLFDTTIAMTIISTN
jgi:hypothetical protein